VVGSTALQIRSPWISVYVVQQLPGFVDHLGRVRTAELLFFF